MWGASPRTFLKAFSGPRGRPDLKNALKKTKPDCLHVPSLLLPLHKSYEGTEKVHEGMAHAGIFPGFQIVKTKAQTHRKSVLDGCPVAGNRRENIETFSRMIMFLF